MLCNNIYVKLISDKFVNHGARNRGFSREQLIYVSLASLSYFLFWINYLQCIFRRISVVKHSKYMMGTSTFFCLGIYMISLMQMFSCKSSKPNIIMIVADDLVSWKFMFSAPYLSAGGYIFSLTFWMGTGWGEAQKKWMLVGTYTLPVADNCLGGRSMFLVKKEFVKEIVTLRAHFRCWSWLYTLILILFCIEKFAKRNDPLRICYVQCIYDKNKILNGNVRNFRKTVILLFM